MKQLLQNMRDGQTAVVDVPVPQPRPGTALVRTQASLVSAGTERMVVEFAEKSLVGKAQSRPDLVKQVINKALREGILPTIESAFNRLDQPMTLGYSSAGIIVETGPGLQGFKPGDRVVCAGAGAAVHAEYAVVPQNLLTLLPEPVDFESGAFTTLGAITMHGFRLAQPQLGESVAVIGMGLLGLLAAGIARAAGCQVLGMDLDPARIELSQLMGFQAVPRADAEQTAQAFTRGRGFDTVLICADTKSDDPVELAGLIARERAVVVAVGAVGMRVPRKIYYEKELDFKISRSYGPGRYDRAYEENGQDYPIGFVRWTEGRNFEAFVQLLASGAVDVKPLISHRFTISDAPQAYELITGRLKQPFLGVVLTYPTEQESAPLTRVEISAPARQALVSGGLSLGVLGAGNYATAMFLPAVKKTGQVNLSVIATASGVTAQHAARKFGFKSASSSESDVLNDPNINLVAILTRHNQHARQVITALENGKHVYCEKPLALNAAELEQIQSSLGGLPQTPLLTVGFNRRFAPLAVELSGFLHGRQEPLAAHYRVNAGFIPALHWVHDPQQGGGRVIGEACHFIDFITFLVGAPPTFVSAHALPDQGRYQQDNVFITLEYPDGSLGSIAYLANGDKSYPKEHLDVFCAGKIAELDDFRQLTLVENGRKRQFRSTQQDKGHAASWQAFLRAVNQGQAHIPYDHLWGVTRASFAVIESLEKAASIRLSE